VNTGGQGSKALTPNICVDETMIRRRGFLRRQLRIDQIRRVHWYAEQDGRRALIFSGSGLRLVAVPEAELVDPNVRAKIAAFVEYLRGRGVQIDADISPSRHHSKPVTDNPAQPEIS
jgi:hypothetical protein